MEKLNIKTAENIQSSETSTPYERASQLRETLNEFHGTRIIGSEALKIVEDAARELNTIMEDLSQSEKSVYTNKEASNDEIYKVVA